MNNIPKKDFYIYLNNDISTETMERLLRIITNEISEKDRLFLLLNSSGGSVSAALGMAKFLISLPCSVISVNMAKVESAAVILFMAGEERIALPNSSFYIHSLSLNLSGNFSMSTLENELKILKNDFCNVIDFLEERTKVQKSKWKNMMTDTGTQLSSKDSLKLGISTNITEIKIPKYAKFF